MANAGLPATSGFVGEFMVILGAVSTTSGLLDRGDDAGTGCGVHVVDVKRVIFGEVANKHVADLVDVNTSRVCDPCACWLLQ